MNASLKGNKIIQKTIQGNCRISKPNLKIQNVVSTADLKQAVDITKFNNYTWGRYDIEYNYNGKVGYIKDYTMQGRVTIFLSGKMISTGSRSIRESIQQLKHALGLLVQNSFVRVIELEPKVRNIVATSEITSRIDLGKLAENLPKSIYEPGQFPGIHIYNINSIKSTTEDSNEMIVSDSIKSTVLIPSQIIPT